VGTGETASGDVDAFRSLTGATPNDEGTLPGGSNSSAIRISPNGTVAVGVSEVAGQVVHSKVESLP
jgi:uncharacterized membrane protein